MENLTFHGTDADLETSLFEYGLLVSDQANEDGSGSHFCVYKYGEGFDTGHIYPKDLDRLLRGEDWASPEDVDGFLSFVGHTLESYPLANKIADLVQYWGADNILGTSYHLMTEEEVRERYLS